MDGTGETGNGCGTDRRNGEAIDLFIAFARELADTAAHAALAHFRKAPAVEKKSERFGFDPVTEADRAAERAMRERIADRFPEHGILGEEYGETPGSAPFTWVLDPIDGTRAFIAGLPSWTTLVALLENGRPVLGLVAQPVLGEHYIGIHRGARRAAWRNDRPIGCTPRPLSEAVLMTTGPEYLEAEEWRAFQALSARVAITRHGFDAYACAMLAAGHVDLVVEAGLAPHDVAALIPLVEGAGGVIGDWNGAPCPGGGRMLAAADQKLFDTARKILSGTAGGRNDRRRPPARPDSPKPQPGTSRK